MSGRPTWAEIDLGAFRRNLDAVARLLPERSRLIAVLKASGVAQALSDTFNDVGLPVIFLAYLISLVLRVAQGSATVAIVTTAGIVAPLLVEGDHSQAFVALVIMAISAGSIFASHVNDGGFWMVAKYFGISERDTLRTWTVLESVLSVAGFVVAAVVSLFV